MFGRKELPKIRLYGWKKDLPDFRDHIFQAAPIQAALPSKIDLRQYCPPVYDQGNLGSCTAQAIAALVQIDEIKLNRPDKATPSRLYIYYNERLIEGTVSSDSGATLRDGIKTLNSQGFCDESLWPYVEKKFTTKPSTKCYTAAKTHLVQKYQAVPQNLNSVKAVLAQGFPIVFGMTVYDSFESDQVAATGIVPLPTHSESMLGGHAMCIVGYDDAKHWFIVRNSWSADWGSKGYCFIPYSYLLDQNLASDFWTVTFVN